MDKVKPSVHQLTTIALGLKGGHESQVLHRLLALILPVLSARSMGDSEHQVFALTALNMVFDRALLFKPHDFHCGSLTATTATPQQVNMFHHVLSFAQLQVLLQVVDMNNAINTIDLSPGVEVLEQSYALSFQFHS